MPTTLSEMIAQHLDAEPDEIEAELRLYLEELSSRIRSGAFHEIDGFGSFESLNGELRFKPTDLLLRAVNFRFENLEPFQVAGQELAAKREVAAKQEVAAGKENIAESDEEPALIVEVEKARLDRPAAPPNEAQKSAHLFTGEADSGRTKSASTRVRQRSFKPARILLLIVPLVIVAVVVAGLIYSDRLFVFSAPDSNLSAQQEATSEPEQAILQPQDIPEASNENVDEISGTDPAIDDQQPAPEEIRSALGSDSDNNSTDNDLAVTDTEDPAGFRSDFDRTAQGYTLMIGWKGRVDLAEDAIAAYQNLELPRAVLSYQAEGITRYRMAIGQYESIEAAQLALERLGNRIPSDSYILRIR